MRMRRQRIQIECSSERLEESRRVLEASVRFGYGERVRVQPGVSTRYLLAARGTDADEYFNSPEAQVCHQLLNAKWHAENIRNDVLWDEGVTVEADFGHVVPVGFIEDVAFKYSKGESPRVVSRRLSDPTDIGRLRAASPNTGLGGKYLEWYREMCAIVRQYEVTVNGAAVPLRVRIGGLGGGIMASCIDLAGENVFIWMVECPELVHELLAKICRAKLDYWRFACEATGKDLPCRGGSGDGAEMLSPAQFCEFYVPYYKKTHLNCGARRHLHMCGSIPHLLEVLRDELRINELNGFGSVVNRHNIGKVLGGRVRLKGNIDPVLLKEATASEIRSEIFDALDTLAPLGGYTLSDGYSIPPGTPVEHINLMMECAREYGKPCMKRGARIDGDTPGEGCA